MMPDTDLDPDRPHGEWWGMRGSRQRVKGLVQSVVEQNERRTAEAEQQAQQRFRDQWEKTNALFDPPTTLRELHKRLHLPLYSAPPPEPIEQVDTAPYEAEAIPEDYQPSGEPLPGTEHLIKAEQGK